MHRIERLRQSHSRATKVYDERHVEHYRSYLQAVLCSRDLFGAGATSFRSGLSNAYYRLLLARKCDIPMEFSAKQCRSELKKDQTSSGRVLPAIADIPFPAASAGTIFLDSDDDVSSRVLPLPAPEPLAPVAKSKGAPTPYQLSKQS